MKEHAISCSMAIIAFTAFLILLGATPKQQMERDQNYAVKAGHAQWTTIVDTNGRPTIKFEWNKPCNK